MSIDVYDRNARVKCNVSLLLLCKVRGEGCLNFMLLFLFVSQFIHQLIKPNERWLPSNKINPFAQKVSVWADVLDWKVFQRTDVTASYERIETEKPSISVVMVS